MDLDTLRRSIATNLDSSAASKTIGEELQRILASELEAVREGAEDPLLVRLCHPKVADVARKVRWSALVINPGSTSTKVAVYSGLVLLAQDELPVAADREDGVEARAEAVRDWMARRGLKLAELSGIAARGGFLAPVPGGTFRVVPAMLQDLEQAPFQHASNLAIPTALRLAESIGPDVVVTITDPVTCDELDPEQRLTGSSLMRRDGLAAHYLNHRAAAGILARELSCSPDQLHIVTCHMGGGMSAARHRNGRLVQVSPGFSGIPSANRAGALPLHQVIRALEQHEFSLSDLKRELLSSGGLLALAGTQDFRALFERGKSDPSAEVRRKIELLRRFFADRIAQAILELSASPERLDAVVLTGGLARDASFCREVCERVHLGVPMVRLPGSVEQQALAAGWLGCCAEPERQPDYVTAREELQDRRRREDELLDLPLFSRPPRRPALPPTRLEHLVELARADELLNVAVVGADNEEALLAVKLAVEAGGMARFLLVGPYTPVSELAWELDVVLDDERVALVDSADPVAASMELLERGLADTVMKGSVMTAALLKGYLDYQKRISAGARRTRLSHLGLFEIPGRERLVAVTDAAINTYPDPEARVEILENALQAMRLLGWTRPKVAVVSAVEKASKAVASSVEGEAIARRLQQREDLIIEGPLSVDLALSPFSAREKRYPGRIRGDADLLLVPDIDAGNAIYKAFTVASGATIAGAVIGGARPFVLTSRGDSSKSKLSSVALALAITRRQKQGSAA